MDFLLPRLVGSAYPLGHDKPALASIIFLVSFVYTAATLGTRRGFSPRLNLAVFALGFLAQTEFLVVRGHLRGRCPLTNLFEVIVFLCWGLALFYLLVGNLYRLSPLGLFTAPSICVLQTFAFVADLDRANSDGRANAELVNPWLEFHAAFSVLSFGAFALAGLAGAMYLWQERQLKSHRLKILFFQLPPISDLIRLNTRLLLVGLALLTLGLGAGFNMGAPNAWPHLVWAIVIWLLYAFIVLASRGRWRLAPRRVASLSVAAFAIALVTLGGLTFVRV